MTRVLLTSAAVLASLACSPKTPEPTTTPVEAADQQADASGEMDWTGILSEEEFKQLHELTDEKVPAPQGTMIDVNGTRAYLSLPEGDGPHPGVVVIHEWWGLNEHIKHWADRLAADGYAAVAVDLYGGDVASTPDEAMKTMRTVNPDEASTILSAAHDFLKTDARIQAPTRGVIGWCFGGGWSLQHALAEPDLDAAVIYYGRLVTDPEKLARIEAPILGVFGNQDEGIPPKSVDAFEAALEEAGVDHRILRYDANHAFANPSSDRYDAEAAESAWKKVRAFLGEHLK